MGMLKILQQLFRSFTDEPVPQKKRTGSSARKKTSSSSSKRKTASSPGRKTASSKRRTGSVSSSSTVYTDQTILGGNAGSLFYAVPQQIRQMRTLSGYNNLNGTRSMESLFYQQGKYMEHYTDDFPDNVLCGRATPMYYNMKDNELRCYFTWRTRYRMGALPAAQNAFLLLYTFELLNLIGVTAPELAYSMLGRLLSDYGEQFPSFRKSLLRWMPDFAAYYQVPYRCDDEKEAAAITILRHSSHTPQELLEALDALSKYRIRNSKLYLAKPDETAEMLKAVYQAMLLHYAEKKKQSYSSFLLGDQKREEHIMFEGAVFYNRTLQMTRDIRLSPLCVYHCCNGKWAKETFCSEPHGDRIGALLRTFDSVLREMLRFKGKLKPGELPEGDEAVIRQALRDYFEEQKRKNAPVITLDASELEAIRAAAAHTTDMLTLPEDEAEQEAPAQPAEPELPDGEAEDTEGDEELPDLPLSAPAMALLICLVTGESYQPLIDAGQMLSVLADEINENLYDTVGDTVIEMEDDETPVLVEDYLEDLKGMLEG
ncbi:MAG: TerB N-terminal domain-containing protein [Oscillospiraceae bacterium]|nr:TerB N-terminal domain-containing protein [Oscillospiraceae bacterium]